MTLDPSSWPGAGGSSGIPQGGPLTAALDAGGFAITEVVLTNAALNDTLDADGNEIDNVSAIAASSGSELALQDGNGQTEMDIRNGFVRIYGNVGFDSATPAVFFRTAAAPADADVQTSGFVLWIDATPAATKLMVKAKDSAGTVKTAAIALA